jgi:hypothetical protein
VIRKYKCRVTLGSFQLLSSTVEFSLSNWPCPFLSIEKWNEKGRAAARVVRKGHGRVNITWRDDVINEPTTDHLWPNRFSNRAQGFSSFLFFCHRIRWCVTSLGAQRVAPSLFIPMCCPYGAEFNWKIKILDCQTDTRAWKNVCLEMYRLPAMSDNINKLLLKLGWIPFFNCFPLGAVHFQYFNTKFDNGRALLHSKEEFGACSTRIIW